MHNFMAYKGEPDEFARFGIGDITFTVITAPEASLNDEAEVIPTMDEKKVLIVLSQEKMDRALPDDAPEMVKGMSVGMIVSACIGLAERWLEDRSKT